MTHLDSKALASVDLSLNNLGSSGEADQATEEVDRGTCSSWPFNRSSPCDGGDAFEMYTRGFLNWLIFSGGSSG